MLLLSTITTPILATCADGSGDNNEQMKTLFQCGVGTEKGFNGWKLTGVSHKTLTYFEDDHIEFFQHDPGNYSIGIEKRVDELIGYTDLRIVVDIAELENCTVNSATAYFSQDGKHWKAMNKDARRGGDVRNEQMDFSFVKLVADVTFFKEGRFRMNGTRVFGNYRPARVSENKTEKKFKGLSVTHLVEVNRNLRIRLDENEDIEIVVHNILGQEVLHERSSGSRRFKAKLPGGIYFVTLLKDDRLITKQKVVL